MDENELQEIIDQFNIEELKLGTAYKDGGIDPLWPRFNRAATNQFCGGAATLSRYGIWANTIRDNICAGLEKAERGDLDSARYFLIRAANSLSAFSEVQKRLDRFID